MRFRHRNTVAITTGGTQGLFGNITTFKVNNLREYKEAATDQAYLFDQVAQLYDDVEVLGCKITIDAYNSDVNSHCALYGVFSTEESGSAATDLAASNSVDNVQERKIPYLRSARMGPRDGSRSQGRVVFKWSKKGWRRFWNADAKTENTQRTTSGDPDGEVFLRLGAADLARSASGTSHSILCRVQWDWFVRLSDPKNFADSLTNNDLGVPVPPTNP